MLHVKAASRSYPVLIENGLLDHLNEHLDPNRFYVVIADDHVPQNHVEKVLRQFPDHLLITFPQGEDNKSLRQAEVIIDRMLANNVLRDAWILAVGGGVTGDLAGFVASVYMRGIPFCQIPTTLLAQIDASVGGKVAVNTEKGKNVIGSFYPPMQVLIDPETLATLPERQFANGMAEMIKYGMIADKHFFAELAKGDAKNHLEEYIARSLTIKKRFVEADEFDEGIRQYLNFGHTYGHALETYYHYEKYLHGEAIAIGMVMVSEDDEIRKRLIDVLKTYRLPYEDPADIDLLKSYVAKDKKKRADGTRFVIVNPIGSASIEIVPETTETR